jgi:hypothetical protein
VPVTKRRSIDHGEPAGRGSLGELPREPAAHLALIDQLRRVAVQLETAEVLERRAGRADDPVLATLLRERATAHRRTAETLRADPSRVAIG